MLSYSSLSSQMKSAILTTKKDSDFIYVWLENTDMDVISEPSKSYSNICLTKSFQLYLMLKQCIVWYTIKSNVVDGNTKKDEKKNEMR